MGPVSQHLSPPFACCWISFLRSVFEGYSLEPPLAPAPQFLSQEIRERWAGHKASPHRGAGPGVQRPRSSASPPSRTSPWGTRGTQPSPRVLTPACTNTASALDGRQELPVRPWGLWGPHLGSPHQPIPGLLGKESSVSVNNGPFEDEIILGSLSFPRGGNPSLRIYGSLLQGK